MGQYELRNATRQSVNLTTMPTRLCFCWVPSVAVRVSTWLVQTPSSSTTATLILRTTCRPWREHIALDSTGKQQSQNPSLAWCFLHLLTDFAQTATLLPLCYLSNTHTHISLHSAPNIDILYLLCNNSLAFWTPPLEHYYKKTKLF